MTFNSKVTKKKQKKKLSNISWRWYSVTSSFLSTWSSVWYSALLINIPNYIYQWPWRLGLNPRSSHPNDKKLVLDITLLNTQHYKVRIKIKWSNPGKGVAPPTPWCSSYQKGSLRVTLDYGRQLIYIYKYIYIYIYIYIKRLMADPGDCRSDD